MGLIKGGFMRFTQTFIYFLAFLCSAVALGIFAYFLSVLADRNAIIPQYAKAVTGISGAGVLYTIIAVVLTCCLGGIAFFGFVAIVLNIAFVGGFIAIAVLTRDGAHSCSGIIRTPLGTAPAFATSGGFRGADGNNEITYAVSQLTACRLNKAVFAVSIIGAFLFLVAAAFQVLLVRSHKKEKRYGPGPSNNYTSGSGNKAKRNFWQRKKKNGTARDAEMGTAAGAGTLAVPAHDNRPSYETGTTIGNGQIGTHDKVADGSHTGYYTQPTGTGVNPYGPTTTGTAANY